MKFEKIYGLPLFFYTYNAVADILPHGLSGSVLSIPGVPVVTEIGDGQIQARVDSSSGASDFPFNSAGPWPLTTVTASPSGFTATTLTTTTIASNTWTVTTQTDGSTVVWPVITDSAQHPIIVECSDCVLSTGIYSFPPVPPFSLSCVPTATDDACTSTPPVNTPISTPIPTPSPGDPSSTPGATPTPSPTPSPDPNDSSSTPDATPTPSPSPTTDPSDPSSTPDWSPTPSPSPTAGPNDQSSTPDSSPTPSPSPTPDPNNPSSTPGIIPVPIPIPNTSLKSNDPSSTPDSSPTPSPNYTPDPNDPSSTPDLSPTPSLSPDPGDSSSTPGITPILNPTPDPNDPSSSPGVTPSPNPSSNPNDSSSTPGLIPTPVPGPAPGPGSGPVPPIVPVPPIIPVPPVVPVPPIGPVPAPGSGSTPTPALTPTPTLSPGQSPSPTNCDEPTTVTDCTVSCSTASPESTVTCYTSVCEKTRTACDALPSTTTTTESSDGCIPTIADNIGDATVTGQCGASCGAPSIAARNIIGAMEARMTAAPQLKERSNLRKRASVKKLGNCDLVPNDHGWNVPSYPKSGSFVANYGTNAFPVAWNPTASNGYYYATRDGCVFTVTKTDIATYKNGLSNSWTPYSGDADLADQNKQLSMDHSYEQFWLKVFINNIPDQTTLTCDEVNVIFFPQDTSCPGVAAKPVNWLTQIMQQLPSTNNAGDIFPISVYLNGDSAKAYCLGTNFDGTEFLGTDHQISSSSPWDDGTSQSSKQILQDQLGMAERIIQTIELLRGNPSDFQSAINRVNNRVFNKLVEIENTIADPTSHSMTWVPDLGHFAPAQAKLANSKLSSLYRDYATSDLENRMNRCSTYMNTLWNLIFENIKTVVGQWNDAANGQADYPAGWNEADVLGIFQVFTANNDHYRTQYPDQDPSQLWSFNFAFDWNTSNTKVRRSPNNTDIVGKQRRQYNTCQWWNEPDPNDIPPDETRDPDPGDPPDESSPVDSPEPSGPPIDTILTPPPPSATTISINPPLDSPDPCDTLPVLRACWRRS